MKKVEGIALQVDKRKVILLTPEGDYLSVPHPGGAVEAGDRVVCNRPSPAWPKFFAAAASLVAAVFLVFSLIPVEDPKIDLAEPADNHYGFLAMDINPSLELVFDENLVVVDCLPFDKEARLLLEDYPDDSRLEVVLEWLLERSVIEGYLDQEVEDNLILATLVESERAGVDPEMLAEIIDEQLLQLEVSAYIGINKADEQARKEADSEGVSLNRYLLFEALRDQVGEKVPVDLPFPEMLINLEVPPAGGIFRSAGKPAVKTPAPFETKDLPEPAVDPPKPADMPADAPEQREKAPEPPVDTPGPPEERPVSPEDLPGPPENKRRP